MSESWHNSSGDWDKGEPLEKPKHSFKEVLKASEESLAALMKATEDPRKTGLKEGLRQLTTEQLGRVINYDGEMVLDEWNYHEGKFCPLAVGLELNKTIKFPTHQKVFDILNGSGRVLYQQ